MSAQWHTQIARGKRSSRLSVEQMENRSLPSTVLAAVPGPVPDEQGYVVMAGIESAPALLQNAKPVLIQGDPREPPPTGAGQGTAALRASAPVDSQGYTVMAGVEAGPGLASAKAQLVLVPSMPGP